MAARGLGKGLDALIPSASPKAGKVDTKAKAVTVDENDDSPKSIVKITKVEPNREQPRKNFDEDALNELAESIKQFGVLQPILVQDRKDYYEIIAGEKMESCHESRSQGSSCNHQESYRAGNHGDFLNREPSERRP